MGLTTDPNDPGLESIKDNGQQEKYLVLSVEEIAKGFVRPVRRSYVHVGPPKPRYPLRALTEEEKARYEGFGYIAFEEFPPSELPLTGRYYTHDMLHRKGCGVKTTMGQALAETYARKPHFYGATFCCGCSTHLPVGAYGEFVWDGTEERVGT